MADDYDDEDAAYEEGEGDFWEEYDEEYENDLSDLQPEGTAVVPLWDIPTRVFHWSLVVLVPAAWWTAENQYYDIHQWIGITVLSLVLFRVIWGFIGSWHSRFVDFIVGWRRVRAYVNNKAPVKVGHNPLGGWSVLLFLFVLFVQSVSGLFNSDDIMYSGPLYYAVSSYVRDVMGSVHDLFFNILLGLIALHVSAVLWHQFHWKEKLIQAMVRGHAEGREGRAAPISSLLALAIVLVVLGRIAIGLLFAPAAPPALPGGEYDISF
ncbi:MAG: hydrogenase [Halioglobus sp.]|nr:hydrogenase [Halioglobus sp.]